MRISRRSKAGVLDRVFQKLQVEQIVRIKLEAVSLDPTSIKVPRMPEGLPMLMDRAYEGDETRQLVLDLGMVPVVPPKSTASSGLPSRT